MDILAKSKPVIDTAREDMPVIREAVSEMSTNPRGALAKITAVFQDIWQKVRETGLIGSIVEYVKTFIGSILGSAHAAGTRALNTVQEQVEQTTSATSSEQPTERKESTVVNEGEKQPLV